MNLDQDVFRIRLRVLHFDVEVPALREDTGVHQLELRDVLSASAVLFDQPAVGEFGLRVLIKKAHVRVRRSAVQIEVVLLDVLAVIALASRQPEQALLQDGIAAVPERDGEADLLMPVGNPCQAVFVPAVGA